MDDHPVFRLGVCHLLLARADYEIVGEATNSSEARRLLRRHRPDLLILDLVLEDGGALEVLHDLETLSPSTRALVVTMLDETLYAERCIRAGAAGFLMKSEASTALVNALDLIDGGEIYLGRRAAGRLARRVAGGTSASVSAIDQLTNREVEVLQLIGQGRRTSEIARLLHISPKTVETHQAKLKRKLGVSNAAELLRLAVHLQTPGLPPVVD